MKNNYNVWTLGFIALGAVMMAFFFELVIPNEQLRNIFAICGGSMIVGIVFYVIVIKMILKR